MRLHKFTELIKNDVTTFGKNMAKLQGQGLAVEECSKEEWMSSFLAWLEYETDMHAVYWAEG